MLQWTIDRVKLRRLDEKKNIVFYSYHNLRERNCFCIYNSINKFMIEAVSVIYKSEKSAWLKLFLYSINLRLSDQNCFCIL